jgi:two-component system chemotaxis sensor kinase CheA
MSIDLSEFHDVFFEECFEGLEVMESGLLTLDQGTDIEEINAIFRAAHSIKGGGASFGFSDISEFTHVMETLLDEMRDGRRSVTRPAVDLLLESVDCLRDMVNAARDKSDNDQPRIDGVKQRLDEMLATPGDTDTPAPVAEEATDGPADTETDQQDAGWNISFKPHADILQSGNDPVRIFRELALLGELSSTADISALPDLSEFEPENCYISWQLELRGNIGREQVVEVFDWSEGDCELDITPLDGSDNVDIAEPPAAQATAPVSPPAVEDSTGDTTPPSETGADTATKQDTPPSAKRKDAGGSKESGSIRVAIDKVDGLINMVGELVITQSMLSQVGEQLEDVNSKTIEGLLDGLAQLERNTRELQECVLQIRMLPISFSFSRFPRLVRDLSSKMGKQIELKISGENTEVDKTVLEKIGDPLVHLVRNSLDHGLETPDRRQAAGKPETGTLHLNARHEGGDIVIEVIDDGAGINRDVVLSKAIEKGLVSESEELTEQRINNLIFEPGFSTAEQVSDVSGRGVGMDVVRRNIRDLGGNVSIDSQPGKGSTVTIRLPLTLAILDGQLARVGGETYIIPLVSIVESLQIRAENVNNITGQAEFYRLRDEYIPIIRLNRIFGMDTGIADLEEGLLVVVESDGRQVGLFVDRLMGQQQVVIKSLETNFRQLQGVSGATILGDGTVALILDVHGLYQCYNAHCSSLADRAMAVA